MTPFFAGSLAMLNSLTEPQRRRAILRVSKTGNENLTEAFKDNVVLDVAGVSGADLDASQRARLTSLIRLYVDNMDAPHARVKMEEVAGQMDRTWFAWIGQTESGGVFYYRIHSPVILIEFDHQVPANLRQYAKDPTVPNPRHIHVVVRTPNGNDYGKDLLRQHYVQHPHNTGQN